MVFDFNIFNVIYFIAIYLLILITLFFIRRKYKFKKLILGWNILYLLAFIIMFSFNTFGKFVDISTIDTKKYSINELKSDLRQLENYLVNKNPLYFADKEEIKKKIDETYNSITKEMTELEFYRLINPIVVAVNCGHTNLSISPFLTENRKDKAKYLPLEVTLLNNKLYVIKNYDDNIKAGNEIISINDKSTSDIINTIVNNISEDGNNDAKKKYIASKHFAAKYYDFIDNSGEYKIEFLDNDNEVHSKTISGVYNKKYNSNAWNLHFQDYTSDYYSYEIKENYAILKIELFSQEKNNEFSKFLNNLFEELKNNNINNLIIDIRGNYGGDHDMSRTLLSHLMSKEAPYFISKLTFLHKLLNYDKPIIPVDDSYNGNVILLTDGANFSTAGHFAALFKYHNIGKIIGGRTSGNQVCTDSSMDAILNNTRMRIRYSTMVYEVDAPLKEKNIGVEADIEVLPTINDILNNNDIVMLEALKELNIK